jgi:ABC-type transporter Mla MlaB component
MTVACGRPGASGIDAASSGFVPLDANARWMLQGEVTTATVARIFEQSATLPLPTSGIVDCDAVDVVDSTAVALLLALKRRAKSEKRAVAFANVPKPLLTLADVYGVADLLTA